MANDKMMTQMSRSPASSPRSTRAADRRRARCASTAFRTAPTGDDAEMFGLVHEMRVRIMTSPAFTGDKVIAAILFERTMDGETKGKPVPTTCGTNGASCRS